MTSKEYIFKCASVSQVLVFKKRKIIGSNKFEKFWISLPAGLLRVFKMIIYIVSLQD